MVRLSKLLLLVFFLAALQNRVPAPILSGPIMRTIAGSSSSLNTGLIAYWKLDEASGTRVDSEPTGTAQDLTDNNTVTSNTGKIGNAGQFTSANAEYLSRADSADLSTGNIDFAFSAWVYLDSKTAIQRFVSKYTTTGNQREYSLAYDSATDRFTFTVSDNGTNFSIVTADVLGSPSTGVFYHLVCIHDSVNNTISIRVNNGTANSLAHTTGVFDSTAIFVIGALGNPSQYADGRIDEVPFWKKVLSASEITELYNAGAGKTCCPF